MAWLIALKLLNNNWTPNNKTHVAVNFEEKRVTLSYISKIIIVLLPVLMQLFFCVAWKVEVAALSSSELGTSETGKDGAIVLLCDVAESL